MPRRDWKQRLRYVKLGGGGVNKVHHGSGENDQYTSTGELQSRSVLKNMINTNLFIKLLNNNLQMPMRTVRP